MFLFLSALSFDSWKASCPAAKVILEVMAGIANKFMAKRGTMTCW